MVKREGASKINSLKQKLWNYEEGGSICMGELEMSVLQKYILFTVLFALGKIQQYIRNL